MFFTSRDQYWIIILFLIHLDVFKVEKLEELANKIVFTDKTQFGKMGPETFRERFEASNDIF